MFYFLALLFIRLILEGVQSLCSPQFKGVYVASQWKKLPVVITFLVLFCF